MPLIFARTNGVEGNKNLFFGGRVANIESDAIMPFKETIVHVSAKGGDNSGAVINDLIFVNEIMEHLLIVLTYI